MTGNTLAFISFINLFIVPLIGLRAYCKKHAIEWRFTTEMFYLYVRHVVLGYLLAQVFQEIIEQTTGIQIQPEMSKYTIVVVVSSLLLNVIMEAADKYLHVHVEIDVRKSKKTKEQ